MPSERHSFLSIVTAGGRTPYRVDQCHQIGNFIHARSDRRRHSGTPSLDCVVHGGSHKIRDPPITAGRTPGHPSHPDVPSGTRAQLIEPPSAVSATSLLSRATRFSPALMLATHLAPLRPAWNGLPVVPSGFSKGETPQAHHNRCIPAGNASLPDAHHDCLSRDIRSPTRHLGCSLHLFEAASHASLVPDHLPMAGTFDPSLQPAPQRALPAGGRSNYGSRQRNSPRDGTSCGELGRPHNIHQLLPASIGVNASARQRLHRGPCCRSAVLPDAVIFPFSGASIPLT